MNFKDYKISDTDINSRNVKSAKDTYNSTDVQGNKNIFDKLPEFIAGKFNAFLDLLGELEFYTKSETEQLIDTRVIKIGAGDMAKNVYDKNNNGVVDKAETATKATSADNGLFTYTQNSAGLTGSGINGKFKCTVAGTFSTIKVNGSNYSVRCGSETSVELTSGSWYSFILDGGIINFKGGGGLTNTKLAAATAGTEHVLAPYTFYSGEKNLKTGAIPTYTQGEAGEVYNSGEQAKLFFRNIPEGYYKNGGETYPYRPEIYAGYSDVAGAIGLSADKVMKGNTILGVAGTGSELNYVVVASSSRPTNPAPNTIWVKSSVPMTQYTMRGIAPSFSTSNGYVYIQYEGTGSTNATLNLIKTNSIYVKIAKVYQWQDGAWKSMEAYIYQNGQWVSVSQAIVQIYPGTSVTTMFTANTGVISGFKISRTANQEGYGMCYIPIDLTGVKTLHIEGSIQSCCGVCLSDKLPQANANPGALSVASQNSSTGYKHDNIWQKTNWAEDTTVTTVNIDEDVPVANYSGTYYLILALYGSHVGIGATMAQITSVTKE